jgi:lactoylglutathione lyase
MITDLGHPAFRVRDVDETLRFYGLLGLNEAFRLHDDDGNLLLVYLHVAGDRFIEVFPGGEGAADGGSFEHVCLVTDDLEADVGRLRTHGVEIFRGPLVGLDGNSQAWVRDPDGNQIELMQLVEDSPQREAARAASGA